MTLTALPSSASAFRTPPAPSGPTSSSPGPRTGFTNPWSDSLVPTASAGIVQAYVAGLTKWQLLIGSGLLLLQREQWRMLESQQRWFGGAQREVMDQWIVRFGGGVPLDG